MSDPAPIDDPAGRARDGPAVEGPGPCLGVPTLAELLDEQGRRWRQGERTPIESFLERVPRLRSDGIALLELIYHEVVLRKELLGETARLDDYSGRFPWIEAELELQFSLDRARDASGTGRTAPLADSTEWPRPVGASTMGPWPEELSGSGVGSAWPDGYEVLGLLGRGGMGVTYKARQRGVNRVVTLKVIAAGSLAGAEQRSRFAQESQAMGRLSHPNIAQIYEMGEHRGQPFLALEYVDGGSLADRLDGTPRPPVQAARLVEALARAMDFAHRRSVVHRDLKPSNVLLTAQGEPKVTDFGLAKCLDSDSEQTRSGQILGTPSYMAPEQADGQVGLIGPPTDVYALGAILYESITGRPPFKAATVLETLEQVRAVEPVSPRRLQPTVPVDLETICLKCLEKEPRHRYATASELAEELGRFLRQEPIHARPIGGLARALRWASRNPALSTLAGVAALAIVTALAVSVIFAVFQARAAADLRAALAEAQSRRRDADRQAADLACERGLALCGQGEIDHGLLWLARGLEIAARADDPALQRAIRINLAGWSGRLNRPRGALGHGGRITSAAFSPRGDTIATGSEDRTARLWDAATGEPIGPPLEHQGPVKTVAFRPDGSAILTLDRDGRATLWSRPPREGGPMRRESLGHPGPISAAAFSPDGRRVLTGGADGTARSWSMEPVREDGVILRHGSPLTLVGFSPDGARVVTVAADQTARLWEFASGERAGPALHPPAPITSVAFSPDGKRLLTGGHDDLTARLWDASTGRPVGPPLRHDGAVHAVAFSPDGRLALTASNDWRARLWDVDPEPRDRPREPILRHEAPVTSAAFSPDGQLVVTGCRDGYARLWDVASGDLVGTPMAQQGEVERIAFRPDGQGVVTAGQAATAWVWDLATRPPRPESVSGEPWPYAMAFSPDRGLLALGGDEGIVRLWDRPAHRPVGRELRHPAEVRSLTFGPDGESLWTACGDGHVRRWDLTSGQLEGRPLPHPHPPTALAVSPDGARIVTGTRGGTISLWDVATGTSLAEQRRHRGLVNAAAFSPDGRLIVTGGADHTARIWDGATLAPRHGPLPHQGMVQSVAFSPDGRLALTGGVDRTARVWDVASGVMAGPPFGDRSPIRTVAFSPDGRTAFLGGIDLPSRFWDLATRKPLGTPLVHPGARVLDVAFDRGGLSVWAACDDLTLRAGSLPPPGDEPLERIILWAEVRTGLGLAGDGEYVRLDPEQWRLRRRRLASTSHAGSP